MSGSDAVETLRRIEKHLAALRHHEERRSRTWLTVQDVAEELQISRDTIDRLINNGKLKAARITTANGDGFRKMYRIKVAWVEEFLDGLVLDVPSSRTTSVRRAPGGEVVDFIG